jgi:hypothetical protein
LGFTHKHWAWYLIVVSRPMPAAPHRYLVVAARRFSAAAIFHGYLIVVFRPLPAAPFLVRRRYLFVVPRPLPAVLPAPAAQRRRRDAVATGEEHLADEQKSRVRGDVPSKNWALGRSSAAQTHVLLAPHTSGPRDVPRCGALSLLQKDAALQGGDLAETAVG